MEKLFLITNESIDIYPFFTFKRRVFVPYDNEIGRLEIKCNHASWRSNYLNSVKGKFPRKSEKAKIIILEDITYKDEFEIECNFARIDFVSDWVDSNILVIEFELHRNFPSPEELHSITTDKIYNLRDKAINNLDISLEEIYELDSIIKNIKLFLEIRNSVYRNYRKQKELNLDEFLEVWRDIEEFIMNGKILFFEGKQAHIDKSVPQEIIDILQLGGYRISLTGKIDIVARVSELFDQGLIEFIAFIAKVHDSVDINVIDYLKNDMRFIIEPL